MQARKLRESLSKISDGLHQWASKTLLVAGAYKQLADLITDTPTQLTESKVFHGMCFELIQFSKLHFFFSYASLTRIENISVTGSKKADL